MNNIKLEPAGYYQHKDWKQGRGVCLIGVKKSKRKNAGTISLRARLHRFEASYFPHSHESGDDLLISL